MKTYERKEFIDRVAKYYIVHVVRWMKGALRL